MTILIAIISLVILVILHELGHFYFAKKFGVRVDEFGIGYPPKLFGKKIGETLYSFNLLPLGGFVRIYGHEERINDPRSFTTKPFWQKSIIILGGVAVFWVIAAILLSIVMVIGAPSLIEDHETTGFIDPKVQIVSVAKDSPADEIGLMIGDVIKSMNGISLDKVISVQEITDRNKGKEIAIVIQRGQTTLDLSLVPRVDTPSGEGPMGVALFRTALKKIPWYWAPVEGVKATWNLTAATVRGWGMVIGSLVTGNGVPEGVEIKGVVGIFELFNGIGSLGISYFLQLIAIIAISLALINSLPIPALDGGWFLFLVIEKVRGKPLNDKLIQKISIFFFFLLIILMIWITIRDVINLL